VENDLIAPANKSICPVQVDLFAGAIKSVLADYQLYRSFLATSGDVGAKILMIPMIPMIPVLSVIS